MSSSQLALVTGASGYVGSEIILAFAQEGYRVRAAVRKAQQGDEFYAKFPELKSQVEFVVVSKPIDEEGAFDDPVKGVDVIAHAASPATFNPKDNEKDVLIPAIHGTTSLLTSAAKEASVKAIVVTTSIVAFLDVDRVRDPTYKLDDEGWNPISYEEAANPKTDGLTVYRASKALAEKAAWAFMEKEKPKFTLTTVGPGWVLGPSNDPSVKSLANVRSSYGMAVAQIFDVEKPSFNPSAPPFVDVRDVALAHVRAVSTKAAAGKRYLALGGPFSNEKAAYTLRKAFPEQASRIGAVTEEEARLPPSFPWDASGLERDLGITYTPFEKTIVDWGEQVLSLPRGPKKAKL